MRDDGLQVAKDSQASHGETPQRSQSVKFESPTGHLEHFLDVLWGRLSRPRETQGLTLSMLSGPRETGEFEAFQD